MYILGAYVGLVFFWELDIKSCKTSNVYNPKMLPGYLKINLEYAYGLKLFQA